MQVESGKAGSRVEERINPHSQAQNLPLGAFHACWNPFSLLPDENLSFPSRVRIFFTAASSWDQKGTHTARGAAGGCKEGESFPALRALSKKEKGFLLKK